MYNQWPQPWAQKNAGYQGMNPSQQMTYPQIPQQYQGGYNWQWQPQSGQQIPQPLIQQQYYGNVNQPSGQTTDFSDINPPPPLDEPPQLRPPEPTDDDSAAVSSEPPKSFEPKDSMEQERLTQLQQQAQQWQVQARQWQEYQQSLVQSWQQSQQLQMLMMQQIQNWMRPEMQGIAMTNEEEEEFEQQWQIFTNQYNRWKEANKNHPNQEAFHQYLGQWHQWQQQLEQSREQVRKFRLQIEPKPRVVQTSLPSILPPPTPSQLPLQQQQPVESSVLIENQPINQRQQREQQQSVESSVLITHQASVMQDNHQQLPQQNKQEMRMMGYQEFRNEKIPNESQLNSDLMGGNVKTQFFNRPPIHPPLGQPLIDQPPNPSDQSAPGHSFQNRSQSPSQYESRGGFGEAFHSRRDDFHDDPRGFGSDNVSRENFDDRNQNFSGSNEEQGLNKSKPVQLFSGFQRPPQPFGTRYQQQQEEKPFGTRYQQQQGEEPFGESDDPYDDYQDNSRFNRSGRMGFGDSQDQFGSKDHYNENKIRKFGSSNDDIDDDERNNFGSRDLFNDSRDNFGGSRDQFGRSQDFGRSRDQLTDSRNQFGGSRESFGGQRDPFSGPRDKFSGSKELLGGFKDNIDGSKDEFGDSTDQFGGSRDQFGGSRDQFGGSRDQFGGSRDQFGGLGEQFGGPRDQFGGARNQFGGPREQFDGPKDRFGVHRDDFRNERGQTDCPKDQLHGPRDNFGNYRDQPSGPRDKFGNFRDQTSDSKDHFDDKDVSGTRDQPVPPSQLTGFRDAFGRPIDQTLGPRDPFSVNRDRTNSRDRVDSRDRGSSRDRFEARERGNSRERPSPRDQVNLSIDQSMGSREPKDQANIPHDLLGISRDSSGPRSQDGPKNSAYGPKDPIRGDSRDQVSHDIRDATSSREPFGGPRDPLISRELLGSPRDQFGGPKDQFGGPKDQFGGPKDQFGGPKDQFNSLKDQFGGPKDQFGSSRDQFGGPRDQFGGPRDQFGGPREQFGSHRDHFGSSRDKIGGSRDQVIASRDQFGRSRNDQEFGGRDDRFDDDNEQFGSSRDQFGGTRDPFGGPRNKFSGPRDNFDSSRDQRGGTRDLFSGPRDHFNGPRGQSGGHRDQLGAPGSRDRYHNPRDQFSGSTGQFNNSSDPKSLSDKPKPLMSSLSDKPKPLMSSLSDKPKPLMSIPLSPQCAQKSLLNTRKVLLEKPKPLMELPTAVLESPKSLLQIPKSRFDTPKPLLEPPKSLSDTTKQIEDASKSLVDSSKSSLNSQKPVDQSLGEQVPRIAGPVRRRFPFEPKGNAFRADSITPIDNSKQSNNMSKEIKNNSNQNKFQKSVPKDKSNNSAKLETNKNESNQKFKQVQPQEKPEITKETLQSDSKFSESQPKEEKRNAHGKPWEENQAKRMKLEELNQKDQSEKLFQQQQGLPHDQQKQQHQEPTPLKPWQQKQLQHEQQKHLQRKKWEPSKPWQPEESRPWQPEYMNEPPKQSDQPLKPWQPDQQSQHPSHWEEEQEDGSKPWQRGKDERLKPWQHKREEPGKSWDRPEDPINKPWQKQRIPPPHPTQQWKNWQENKENPEESRLEPFESGRDEKHPAGRGLPPPRHFDRKVYDYDEPPYPYDHYDDSRREHSGRLRERFEYGDWKDDRLTRPSQKDPGPDFLDNRRRFDYSEDRERFLGARPYPHPDIGRNRVEDDRRFDSRPREVLPTTTIDYGHRPPPKDIDLLPRYSEIGGILSQVQKVKAIDYGHGQHAPLATELKMSEFLREKEKEKPNIETGQPVPPIREIAVDKVIFDYDKDRGGRLVEPDPTSRDTRDQLFPQPRETREQLFPQSHDTRDQPFPQSHDTRDQPFPQSRDTRELFNRERFKGSDSDRENLNKGQTDSKSDRRPRDSDTKVDSERSDPKYRRTETKSETVLIEDLLNFPGRKNRPSRIVVIIRGPPGAGKTFVAKLIKDKEVENGGSAPRMLCLDDYFMVEVERTVTDSETGKKVKKKVMEYEYEAEMENSYRGSLFKTFKKTVEDGFFPFIIVDAVNNGIRHFNEFWSFAKQKGFQVYIVELTGDASACSKRNTHNRTMAEITKIINTWEPTPRHHLRLDVRSLLQDAAIPEVEMEDFVVEDSKNKPEKKSKEIKEVLPEGVVVKSRWEQFEASEERLDKLDGIRTNKRKRDPSPQRIEDYLQLPDDYEFRQSKPGQKRVRWADIEERKDQEKKRAMGFVIGQTDWAKMTDDLHPERCLKQTKYI